jgi:hypothetical protein
MNARKRKTIKAPPEVSAQARIGQWLRARGQVLYATGNECWSPYQYTSMRLNLEPSGIASEYVYNRVITTRETEKFLKSVTALPEAA